MIEGHSHLKRVSSAVSQFETLWPGHGTVLPKERGLWKGVVFGDSCMLGDGIVGEKTVVSVLKELSLFMCKKLGCGQSTHTGKVPILEQYALFFDKYVMGTKELPSW